MTDICIIGAGPYGLSIAAHLKARGLAFRIFGSPMHTWLAEMPKGMRLKSEGFASSIYDPNSDLTLAKYCKQQEIPYADMGLPVKLETFISYGLEFQRKFVPELENKLVVSLRRSDSGFEIRLADGEIVRARKVVVAAGITHFKHIPPILRALPEEFVTHSSRHCDLHDFKGREVAVIGAGASAVDLAALLHQAGSKVQLVARKPAIRFHTRPERIPPPLSQRIRSPITGIGPGWNLVFYTSAPLVFRQLPQSTRLDKLRNTLGPAPGWFVTDEVVGKVPLNLGLTITEAKISEGRVNLQLTGVDGSRRTLVADHVIAATGFKVDLASLPFLRDDLLSSILSVDQAPVLSSNFESSVEGLYFVGVSAATTFGPLLRFAFGARFAAARLAKHFAGSVIRNSTPVRSTTANGTGLGT